jgi:Sec-independent protein secretion pathway component TatC
MCIVIVYLIKINVVNTPATQQESNLMYTGILIFGVLIT